jgi:hypothetical protein
MDRAGAGQQATPSSSCAMRGAGSAIVGASSLTTSITIASLLCSGSTQFEDRRIDGEADQFGAVTVNGG